MNRKYLLKSGIRVARLARVLAKSIDMFIVLIFIVALYPFGTILGALYLAFSDALYNGQSVGKRFIGFSVVSLEDGEPCSVRQSLIRNLPFSIPMLFLLIPLWGWVFSAIIGGGLMILEVYLLFKLDSGNRLGDVMADTTVIAAGSDGESLKSKTSSWFEANKALPG